jgi:hypothetical protein
MGRAVLQVLGMAFAPDDGQFMSVTRGRLGHYVASTWTLQTAGASAPGAYTMRLDLSGPLSRKRLAFSSQAL